MGEQLDAHRQRQQLLHALHADLTMTGMYNVLEKLREIEAMSRDQQAGSVSARSYADALTRAAPGADASGSGAQMLTAKERKIHDDGLVSVLKQIHDDLDAAVFEAYGWPGTLSDEEILERLVALNHERAAEEATGKVRWLRPVFQNPQSGPDGGAAKTQQTFAIAEPDDDSDDEPAAQPGRKRKGAKAKGAKGTGSPTKTPWPSTLPDRIRAVRHALTTLAKPATSADLAAGFLRANRDQVEELLETLVAVGQARRVRGGKYAV